MDNTKKPEQNNIPDKKEIRKQLVDKIAASIPELKIILGEKKFHHRIKKAVKLITEGLHKKETTKAVKKAVAKKAPARKTGAKAKTTRKPTL